MPGKRLAPDTSALLESARDRLRGEGPMPPIITYCSMKGQVAQMLAYSAPSDGGPQPPLSEVVDELLTALWDHLGPPAWVGVVADTYVRYPGPEVAEEFAGAPLAEAFAAGDPTVGEQLALVCAVRGGGVIGMSQGYRYLPSEGWEFDEPQIWPPDGDLAEGLAAFVGD